MCTQLLYIRAEQYYYFSITIDAQATIYDTEYLTIFTVEISQSIA